MFDKSQSFFEHKSRRTECDSKLKKLKNHFKPKDVPYKLEILHQTSRHLNTCPLELKPTKLDDSSLEYYKEKKASKSKRGYKKGTTKYNFENSNEQCLDASILTGLKTVIDLCGLLEECDKESKLQLEREKDKKNIRNQKATSSNSLLTKKKCLQIDDKLNSSSSSQTNNSFHEQCECHKINKPSSEPSSFRKLLTRASRSYILNLSSSKSSSILSVPEQNKAPIQPSTQSVKSLVTLNTHVSEETVYSQTQSIEQPKKYIQIYTAKYDKSPKKSMKPIEEEPQPHVSSNIHSTSFVKNKTTCGRPPSSYRKPCGAPDSPCRAKTTVADENIVVTASKQSLRRRSYEDDIHQYWAKRNDVAQTEYTPSRTTKPSSLHSITGDRGPSREISSTGLVKDDERNSEHRTTRQTNLSAKCFAPLEIVPNEVHSTHQRPLTRRTFCNEDRCVVHPECSTSEEDTTTVRHNPIPTRHTAIYDPSMLCNKTFTTPIVKNQVEIKKSRDGVPLVQPVLGFCSSAQCGGEHLKSIKYALVKISEFIGFNTYEIMKPYKQKPKHIPTCIAEIFVTSRVAKSEEKYIVTRTVPVERQIPEDTATARTSQVCTKPIVQPVVTQASVQESVLYKETPSGCKCVKVAVTEEMIRQPVCSKEISAVRSKQVIDTEPCRQLEQLVTPRGSVVEVSTYKQSEISCVQKPEAQMENLIKNNSAPQPTLEHSVVLREFDTYREPSKTEKPFQVHSKEISRTGSRPPSFMTSTTIDSNMATESVQFRRSALRATESGKVCSKTTHFEEPSNAGQVHGQSISHQQIQESNILRDKKSRSVHSKNQESFHSAR